MGRIEVDQASFRVVGGPQRVTMDQGRDTSFAVAADGRRIAFSTARGNARVWLFRLAAGGSSVEDGPRVLTGPDDDVLSVDLAPRGNTLAVQVERPGTARHARELRAIRIADGHQTTLAVFDSERGLNAFAPRWSPDETRIAYRVTERGPSGSFLISIHTVDMSGVDRQVTTPANIGLEVPYDVEIGVGGGWLAVPVLHPEGSIWMLEPPDGTGRH